VQVRVGLSYVSAAGALANLDAERPSWSFARVRAQARARWNRALSAIYVSGGSSALKRTFYTMLYHALLSPNVFSDADGHYAGMDRRIHAVPAGETRYANFSGWDVYRTQIPLLAMLFPTRASDFVSSLVADAHESGWLPKWSLANMHTDVMVGDPATAAIAGAYAFGAREFDRRAALAAMVKGATSSGRSSNGNYVERPGLATYRLLGYVSFEQNSLLGNVASFIDTNAVWGSASTTLEYEAADFALARYALANGDRATADAMIARARAWTRMLAPSRFLQPRSLTGMFSPGLTPTGGVGFVEGDSAQYTWAVPWDLAGLFAAIGGRGVAEQRLDFFFQHLNDGPSSPYAFLGNEPTLEVPYEYDWLGKPYKTQSVVRRALLTLYDASPAGFPGNDDLGTMSSWYVLSALGLYPEIPGTDVLAIASPLFRRAQVRLAHGTLTIEAPRAAANAPYVHGLLLGGNAHAAPWLTFGSIDHGGRLRFDLARTPDPSWGSADRLAPPSFGP
jgi:predicted alpha-1,2-mannosidase